MTTIKASELVVGDVVVSGMNHPLRPGDTTVERIESDSTFVRVNGLVDIHRNTKVRVER